jgi:hypothetical protein
MMATFVYCLMAATGTLAALTASSSEPAGQAKILAGAALTMLAFHLLGWLPE